MNASPPKTSENTKCSSWPYWIPVALYAAAIFYLSSLQSFDVMPPFPNFDKLVHFVLYTGFAFLVARAVAVQFARVNRFTLWAAIVISAVYGASDEFHQYFVPMRNCEMWDWVADLSGSVVGVMMYATFNFWMLKRYMTLKTRMENNS